MASPDEQQKGFVVGEEALSKIFDDIAQDGARPSKIFKVPDNRQMTQGTPTPGSVAQAGSATMPRWQNEVFGDFDELMRESWSLKDMEILPNHNYDDFHTLRHIPTGKRYRLTQHDLKTYEDWMREGRLANSSPIETKTHIMFQGYVLCGFTRERPVDWPKGHEWMPLDSFYGMDRSTRMTFPVAICEKCKEAARQLPR